MSKIKRGKCGLLTVVSGPSGVGKSTIVKRLLKINPRLKLSISCTSRSKRPGETEGKDYFFTTRKDFSKKVGADFFLEWAEVHGHFYGTPKNYVKKCLTEKQTVLLELDVQGAASVKEWISEQKTVIPAVFIFLIPPSVDILAFRLKRRKTENAELMNYRLRAAIAELKVMEKYDYIVVNDKVENAAQKIMAIINVEKERVLIN